MELRKSSKWDRRVNIANSRLRVVDAPPAEPTRPTLVPRGLAPADVAATEALLRAAATLCPFRATLLVGVDDGTAAGTRRLVISSDENGVHTELLADEPMTDNLTELVSHHETITQLQAMLDSCEAGRCIVVLVIGVDRLRAINTARGYEGGDELLVWLAAALQARIDNDDIIGRWYGDEFVIATTSKQSNDEIFAFAELLRNCPADQRPSTPAHGVTLSAGVAVGDSSRAASDLLAEADRALGLAKSNGRDRTQMLTSHTRNIAHRTLTPDERLRRALDNGSITNSYQPIYDTRSQLIVAMEALMRMAEDNQSPESPVEVLRAATDTALQRDVYVQLMTQALRKTGQWAAIAPDLVVALNLDARQFLEPGLHLLMARWLQQMGLHAENVGLEVDESVIRSRPIESAEIVHNLQGMGLRVYIEGAQGGPGTLEIVHTLRPEGVKLNRLLVAAIDERWAAQVVESVTKTLFAMEVDVTAVGVSTAVQYERLCSLGVPRVQGYLFAPPLPDKLADALLIENARARIQVS